MQKYLVKFNKALNFTVLFLIFFIPLYFKFPLLFVKGTFVTIRLEDVLIFFAAILWFLTVITSGKLKEVLEDRLNQTILVFFFVGGVSVISAAFLTHTVSLHLGLFHLVRRVEMIVLLPIAYWAVKERRQVGIYLFGLITATLIVCLYALGQKYLNFPAISTINSELSKGLVYYLGVFDRVNSTFSGHYDLAVFLVMSSTLILAIFLYFFEKKDALSEKKQPLIYLGIIFIFSLVILIMTAARLSFVAGVAGIFFVLLFLKKKRYLLIGALVLVGILLYPSQLRNRLISTFTVNIQGSWSKYFAVSEEQEERSKLNIPTLPATGNKVETVGVESADIVPGEPTDTTQLAIYRSFEIRTKVEWPRAIRAFLKNPILGTGYSSLSLATDNDFLRSLGEVGILGTLAFILVIVEVVKRLWKQAFGFTGFFKYLSIGTLSMTLAFLVNSLFIDVFEASKVAYLFWLIIGITFGVGKISTKGEHV